MDYNKREIPNIVPVIIFLTGFLPGQRVYRMASMIALILLLLLTERITKQELPGGDLKLISAMAFAYGAVETVLVLALVGVGVAAVSFVKKLPLKRNIPLCSYVAPAFALVSVTNIIYELGGY